MPAGPGSPDAEGVWQFGEADTESLASDLLNLGQESVSTQFGLDRARLTTLEAEITDYAAFTPTVSGFTLGNGTKTGQTRHVGQDTEVIVRLTLGSTSAVTASIDVTLPENAAAGFVSFEPVGGGVAFDTSGGSFNQLTAHLISASVIRAYLIGTAGAYATFATIGATVPFTWATGDQIGIRAIYRRA